MKKKIKFYRALVFEVIETLCSICMYLDHDARYNRNPCGMYMRSHIDELKKLSIELRSKEDYYTERK